MQLLKSFWYLAILCLAVINGFAEQSPVVLLQQIADQTISQLKAQRLVFKEHPQAVHDLVEKNLLPYVDMTLLSRAVLGKYWNIASAVQRNEFIKRFTTILVNTYASALSSYKNETVQFLPVRGGYQGKNSVLVDSKIIRQGASAIPVSYRLVRRGNTWKVYDLIVDGVSLVQSYRAQFSSVLQKSGMSGLLKQMAIHNVKVGT